MDSDLSDQVQRLTDRFWSDAASVDEADTLPEAHLDELAAAGLYGIFAPTSEGGRGLSFPEVCSVVEQLASGCLASTFVWMQHFGLLATLLDPSTPAPPRSALLPGALRGEIKGGLALAGLLPGPARLSAHPTEGGWTVTGDAPWVSGWGLVDLIHVVARAPEETTVSLLVDARDQPGLTATRVRLAAANATASVRLRFDALFVDDDRCTGQAPFDPVRQQVEGLRPNGSLALGVARRCCVLIGDSPLDDELRACRADLDATAPGDMPASRARASELAVRASHALSAHRGSTSVLRGDPAERLGREAAFLLVFGTRPGIKSALLRHFHAGP